MALTGLAIAAALALAKDKMVDEPAANRQRKLAASTQRLSPWTGLTAKAPQDPNAIGQMLQYGATGAAIGSNISGGKPAMGANADPYGTATSMNPSTTGSMTGDPYSFFGVKANPTQQ